MILSKSSFQNVKKKTFVIRIESYVHDLVKHFSSFTSHNIIKCKILYIINAGHVFTQTTVHKLVLSQKKGISFSVSFAKVNTASERDHCASRSVHAKLVVCRLYSNN